MPQITPRLPKGMRDFLPADMLRRQYVISTVSGVFETFGYEPIQTPVMELQEMLMGNYGADAEKLIFYAKHPQGEEELALRYDLTVPVARFFAMHEADLPLPFKRYHIAPVWRAERPQRGRFREFIQCDADIVGVAGMEADAESISLVTTVLQKLGFADFQVKLNNRKLLIGIGHYAGLTGDALSNLYRSIDKLDKIGVDGVKEEMIKGGLEAGVVSKVMDLVATAKPSAETNYKTNDTTLNNLRKVLQDSPIAVEGLNELEQVLGYLESMRVPGRFVALDFSMVRGLSYYTGPIFETALLSDDPEERVGSVSGGGRYDNMIGLFRKTSLPTTGVSLGIERLITLLDKRNVYPANLRKTVVEVLVTVFGPDTKADSLGAISRLREGAVSTELYMQDAKLGKQLGYADKKGIPVVAILGPDEVSAGKIKFKRLADQFEATVAVEDAVQTARQLLGK